MFKFLVILISFGIVASQRSQFVDYILDLQYAVGYIHDEIQDTTWQTRYDMSDELTEIVKDAMTEITNGLTTYLGMRDRYTGYIEANRTPENTQCIDTAIANWPRIQNAAGAAIAVCGSNPMNPLHLNVFGYHNFVNSHRQLKFDAQNIVLNAFTKVNPMTNVMDLSPTVEQDINTIYDRYQAEVVPELTTRLEGFAQLRSEIPPEVHDCIATALNNFSSQAGLIVQASASC
ncbi:hypothetical protein ACKWTF_016296 [Chironomus riparius]